MKHTHENYYMLHGYLEWWKELKDRKQRKVTSGSGQVALANAKPQLSLMSQVKTPNDLTTVLSN